MRNIILLVLCLLLLTPVFARDASVPFVPNFNQGGGDVNITNFVNSSTFNGTLEEYAKLNSSNQPFYDSSLFDSINTGLRILYNNAGNPLCTWSNALGTGFDCVTLSQNGHTVLDSSNFVSYVNETYGNHYCENSTTIVIGAYHAC